MGMNESRTANSARNLAVSIAYQVLLTILNFVSRTILVYCLGEVFLGLNSVFYDVLALLSIAELGVGNAIIFCLYKPLAEGDTRKVSAIINLFKKIYHTIGIVIFGGGLCLIPFLNFFIKLDQPIEHLTLYYVAALLSTCVTYIYSFYQNLYLADQKFYKIKIYDCCFTIFIYIFQILALIIFRNFFLYLIIRGIIWLVRDRFIATRAFKHYPHLKQKEVILPEEKKEIFFSIKSMFLYKIGDVILKNTDYLLISTLIGTVIVGYYSNYNMIINSITAFTTALFSSLLASIGNLSVDSSAKKQYQVFKIINFLSFWIFAFCTISLFCLFNDFITLWFNANFVLHTAMPIVCINFYLLGMLQPIWNFRDATGLFNATKYVSLYASILNLIFSIGLGLVIGLPGILLGTTLSRLLTNFWYEPLKLYTAHFKEKVSSYFKTQAFYGILLLAIGALTYFSTKNINAATLSGFLIKCVCVAVIPNLVLLLLFFKSEAFQYLWHLALGFIKRKK
ncbi:MAG: hypothetical protein PHG02_04725 [Oscillospiraceae bacterium]|nr:hypothetical protein [Oscillospiraceae bacterium]